ncbi:MAG: hypothetical protein IPM54_12260 [Polyangiaceae bacterium]|nr:hypothetical protein [Polyangiaceae bacterium]
MSTLDDLVERLRQAAGAEFAFALTREAALVTRDAPPLMPEAGRKLLATAAEVLIGKRDVGFLSLPRGDLVPYGGPGHVDVGFGVAASARIVCVVMTNSASRHSVREAMEQQLPVIEAFLAPPDAPHAAPHIEVRAQAMIGDETLAAINLDELLQNAPVITVGPAPKLGRETLAAIELDTKRRDIPAITVGPAPKLGRETLAAIHLDEDKHEAPRIAVEPVRKLGRETLAAIERDMIVEGPALEKPPVPPDLWRKTLPWIDPTLVGRQSPTDPNSGGTKGT